jgi:hypothetical protein
MGNCEKCIRRSEMRFRKVRDIKGKREIEI